MSLKKEEEKMILCNSFSLLILGIHETPYEIMVNLSCFCS